MSNDLNQCQFIGRLGKDIDMRFTASGESIANFTLACGWESKDKTGQKKEGTEWVNVSVFGKLGEICGQYLTKGSQAFVQGRMATHKYTDKQSGQEKYSTHIYADKVQFLGSKVDKENGAGTPPLNKGAGNTNPSDFDTMAEDIPF
jgi:single-strand DNA-binding protein